ncbi:MAG: GIY-YIG nuclease family protein [Rhodospirillaceae bacterium]
MIGFKDFEFDLPRALLHSLVQEFEGVQPAPLTATAVAEVPETQGVYQLFKDGQLVYIGKTDADSGLNRRLTRHAQKILFRQALSPEQVSFKAIRVYVFTAMDLETDLIRHFGGVASLAWNGSGFGSNDPGRERDTTRVKDSNFDALYPIDIDREITWTGPDGGPVSVVLGALKEHLPYTLRFEGARGRSRQPHPDLAVAEMPAFAGPVTVRSLMAGVVSVLPSGWQATALLGYVILYKERWDYPQGAVIARAP